MITVTFRHQERHLFRNEYLPVIHSDEIAAGNKDLSTQINTIAFASENDVQSLQAIAQENNGTYRRVTITP